MPEQGEVEVNIVPVPCGHLRILAVDHQGQFLQVASTTVRDQSGTVLPMLSRSGRLRLPGLDPLSSEWYGASPWNYVPAGPLDVEAELVDGTVIARTVTVQAGETLDVLLSR